MATLKQIRGRIRSVRSTQQITKAMEMVAAAKLKRAQDRALASRPYAVQIAAMLQSLSVAARSLSHPLFEVRKVERRALVAIASDKGLCGSHNMNVFRSAEKHLEGVDRAEVALVPVGRRTVQYFGKRGWRMPYEIRELGDQIDFVKARLLAGELIRLFQDREVDLVEILFTRYHSTTVRRVVVEQLLPIAPAEGAPEQAAEYIFEPSPEAIFRSLLPRYVESRVLQSIAESIASEHAARMISMGGATRNAKDVIDHLTLVRNRLRQAAITREISEIVGGANALQ